MKARRLRQDLAQAAAAPDRAARLAALATRLDELRRAHADIGPGTPDAQAKADAAAGLLAEVAQALAAARGAGDGPPKDAEGDF